MLDTFPDDVKRHMMEFLSVRDARRLQIAYPCAYGGLYIHVKGEMPPHAMETYVNAFEDVIESDAWELEMVDDVMRLTHLRPASHNLKKARAIVHAQTTHDEFLPCRVAFFPYVKPMPYFTNTEYGKLSHCTFRHQIEAKILHGIQYHHFARSVIPFALHTTCLSINISPTYWYTNTYVDMYFDELNNGNIIHSIYYNESAEKEWYGCAAHAALRAGYLPRLGHNVDRNGDYVVNYVPWVKPHAFWYVVVACFVYVVDPDDPVDGLAVLRMALSACRHLDHPRTKFIQLAIQTDHHALREIPDVVRVIWKHTPITIDVNPDLIPTRYLYMHRPREIPDVMPPIQLRIRASQYARLSGGVQREDGT